MAEDYRRPDPARRLQYLLTISTNPGLPRRPATVRRIPPSSIVHPSV